MVTLTGGNSGGQEILWPEGETHIIIEGNVYRLEGNQGVYEGDE